MVLAAVLSTVAGIVDDEPDPSDSPMPLPSSSVVHPNASSCMHNTEGPMERTRIDIAPR
jgi:hypothetical protein